MEQQDKKISQMTQLTNISGDEIVPVVKSGGNYSALVSQIVALARQTMVAAETGKGLSANDFTDAFKAKLEGLSNYDDAEVRSLITAVNGRLDTILGDGASTAIDTFNEIEAFLTGITDTQTLTGLLAEQKQTITSETDAKLSGKVDKVAGKGLSANDYTDADKTKLEKLPTNEQYTIKGYFLGKTGVFAKAGSDVSCITPLLPLNKTYPIVLKNVRASGNAVAVCFYDATGSFISYPEGIENLNGNFTVSADKYPANACYFIACSEKAGSTYTNGPTQEAREGAVSEAIQAAITAAVDEELIAEATAAGVVFNRNSGYFELNGLKDITAEQMRTIMAAGAKQSSTLNWAYVMSTIRTHLPRVGSGQSADAEATFRSCVFLEAVEMPNLILQAEVFFDCNRLRSVNLKCSPIYALNYTARANFQGCSKLVELRGALRGNFGFNIADSPLLSLASFQYMVDNAYNTAPITITLHPDAFARLTTELVEAATAKQITFATTN